MLGAVFGLLLIFWGKKIWRPEASGITKSAAVILFATGIWFVGGFVLSLGVGAVLQYAKTQTSSYAQPTSVAQQVFAPTSTPYIPPPPNTLPASSPSATSTLLREVFIDNRNNWQLIPDKAYLEGNTYHIKQTEEGYSLWVPCNGCGTFADFTFETTISLIEGSNDYSSGMMFRQGSKGNFYIFGISAKGKYTFEKLVNNEWQTIIPLTPSNFIHQGKAKNKLRVVAKGSNFNFYINDGFAGSATDNSFPSGLIGLGVNTTGMHIAVDMVRIEQETGSVSIAQPTPSRTATTEAAPSWFRLESSKDGFDLRLSDSINGNPRNILHVGDNDQQVLSAVWFPNFQVPTILVTTNDSAYSIDNPTGGYNVAYKKIGKLEVVMLNSESVKRDAIAERTSQWASEASYRNIQNMISDAILSPNSQTIAAFFRTENGEQCPGIINRNGMGFKKLSECEADDHPRYWSTDGKWIVVWSEKSLALFAYEVDGNRRVPFSQLGKITVYDERYFPWRETNAPVCKGASFWECE